MITLTFDTWEEFDNAISSITTLTIAMNEKDNQMKMKSVAHYQKQYDTMVKIAKSSLDSGVDLTPQFERELLSLTRLLKSIGGKV